ncbi:hypothetical protein ABZS66_49125 [Dactylosporangium sp. NPDC005572]|uniref:hypothetical protein n=1 Tax=Dactylosporangium sp. NPDC005572 TaxID=3156889 RepID=UPI0033B8776E
MVDPLRPSLFTKMRATLSGERDAVVLEAMRAAGRVAYDEFVAAELLRDRLAAEGVSLWDVSGNAGTQLVAAWNAFVLQTLSERFLDADYQARPGTAGFVPAVTFAQVYAWLAAVELWVSHARQARVNPDYDLTQAMRLPAPLPAWAEGEPCPPEHLARLLAAVPPVREQIDIALHALERGEVPSRQQSSFNRLKQLAAQGAAAADYAVGLRTDQHHPALHGRIEANLHGALESWFLVGQLAAMPRLLMEPQAQRPVAPRDERLPGGWRFDPWCLTDRVTLARWQRDKQAAHAIREMWRLDPDPAATLALRAAIDGLLAIGDLALHRTPDGSTHYYECPWSPMYDVRRPTRFAGIALNPGQQFALRARGAEPRGIVLGPFKGAGEVRPWR